MRALLALRGIRGLGRQNRIAALALLPPLLILEQQRRPGPAQMPFHIVGQHTQKNVRRHSILGAMSNRPHQQIDSLQTLKSSFHFRQALVAPHCLVRRKSFHRLAGAQHINPVQLLFLLDRFRTTIPGQAALADFARKVFAHFVLGQYKMGKHFACKIGEGSLTWNRRAESIEQEEKLDGIYVLRTSEPVERLSADETVRSYKSLAEVERAFQCLKGIDLLVRPIRHRTEDRVPAHIFLCVLAYYVEWHLRRAWAPLLFEDEERWEERKRRDPILTAKPADSAQRKKSSHETVEGLPAHSFEDLLSALASRARVTYALKSGKAEEKTSVTFRQVPGPTPVEAKAYELVRTFPVPGK